MAIGLAAAADAASRLALVRQLWHTGPRCRSRVCIASLSRSVYDRARPSLRRTDFNSGRLVRWRGTCTTGAGAAAGTAAGDETGETGDVAGAVFAEAPATARFGLRAAGFRDRAVTVGAAAADFFVALAAGLEVPDAGLAGAGLAGAHFAAPDFPVADLAVGRLMVADFAVADLAADFLATVTSDSSAASRRSFSLCFLE